MQPSSYGRLLESSARAAQGIAEDNSNVLTTYTSLNLPSIS